MALGTLSELEWIFIVSRPTARARAGARRLFRPPPPAGGRSGRRGAGGAAQRAETTPCARRWPPLLPSQSPGVGLPARQQPPLPGRSPRARWGGLELEHPCARAGIGANDVANSFGSSVGSRALTMGQAIVVASICEFVGAVLLGANVAGTIKSGIARITVYQDAPDIFMIGAASERAEATARPAGQLAEPALMMRRHASGAHCRGLLAGPGHVP